jgi:hypothetical protein
MSVQAILLGRSHYAYIPKQKKDKNFVSVAVFWVVTLVSISKISRRHNPKVHD